MATTTDLVFHMNKYLANLNVLNVKIHNFHWNVTGPEFFALHSKFEGLYNEAFEVIDKVAERIIMIGGKPTASLKIYLEHAVLREANTHDYTGQAAIKELMEDYKILLAEVRGIYKMAESLEDDVTSSLMTEIRENYEKNVWMLSACLK